MKYRGSSNRSRTISVWKNIARRRQWFARQMSPGTVKNFTAASAGYLAGAEKLRSLPVAIKVDISPLCNLRCPFCVHGTANPKARNFHKGQRMGLQNFERLVDEVKGHTSAFSLYYLGDPLTHPDLNEMCSIARKAKIYTYVSTNFSFNLDDDDIHELVSSGLSHIKVCVDGLSQEAYEHSRVGGRVATVLDNLRRVCEVRKRIGADMQVEVQFVINEKNESELDATRELVESYGVDEMTAYRGADYSMEEILPENFEITGPRDQGFLKSCYWPYFFMTLKWNGDVIPCCSHRQAEQYDPLREPVDLMGNIFETSVAEVWNSAAYQSVRRVVKRPQEMFENETPSDSFCYGCHRVCNREKKETLVAKPSETDLPLYELKVA